MTTQVVYMSANFSKGLKCYHGNAQINLYFLPWDFLLFDVWYLIKIFVKLFSNEPFLFFELFSNEPFLLFKVFDNHPFKLLRLCWCTSICTSICDSIFASMCTSICAWGFSYMCPSLTTKKRSIRNPKLNGENQTARWAMGIFLEC